MKRILIFIIALMAVLATSWALLQPDFFRVHDYVHAARIAELLRAVQDGHIPVRWSENFGYGFGMPLFEFYAPLPYYVGAFFYWLGINIIIVIKLLFVICSALSFWGMYELGKRLFGRVGGVVAGLAFTLAPYRAVNLFVRGAVSEAWGMMALPWVLLGIVMVVRREKHGWAVLVFGLVTLFLSHNLTTLLFVPVSIVFAAGYWLTWHWPMFFPRATEKQKLSPAKQAKTEKKKKTVAIVSRDNRFLTLFEKAGKPVLVLAASFVLAILLGAFYLFPALLEKDLTKVNGVLGGYFHYSHHFLYIRQFFVPNWGWDGSNGGPNDGMSFFLGYGQLIGVGFLVLAIGRFILSIFQKNNKKITMSLLSKQLWYVILFAGLLGFALYMTLLKSKFIWDAIPLMITVQFPWRWLSVATVFLGLMTGAVTWFLPHKILRVSYAIMIGFIIVVGNTYFFRPEKYLENSTAFYYTDAPQIQTVMSGVLNDYIPVQMPQKLPAVTQPIFEPAPSKDYEVTLDRVHQKMIATHFTEPTTVQFAIADFPGWQAELNGISLKTVRGTYGNIAVEVPAGNHQLGVFFGTSPVRAWSDAASGLGVVILLGLLVWQTQTKKRS